MVRNHHLAKSIHDAGWGQFITWVNAYGAMHDIPVIAVAPQFTSQQCSACGTLVKKSLSVRTHICHGCGVVLDRDHNAAQNILRIGTLGHRVRRFGAYQIAPQEQVVESSYHLRHLADLEGKPKGEKSMSGKRLSMKVCSVKCRKSWMHEILKRREAKPELVEP